MSSDTSEYHAYLIGADACRQAWKAAFMMAFTLERWRRPRGAVRCDHSYLDSALHRLQKADRLRVPDVRHLVRLGRPNGVEDQRKLFLEVLRE